MKQNKFFSLLATTMLAAAATVVFIACSDDDDVIVSTPQSFSYQATVFGSSDSQRLLLDSLTADITDVACTASWLKATAVPASEDRAIDIVSTAPSTDGTKATITVTDADGNHATVTVQHKPMGDGDATSGANDSWIDEWWLHETVDLEGIANAQKAPWIEEAQGHIPEEIRVQYKPDQGWEMAFSYLNDKSLMNTRYFALYNKWTGQMRVWTYVDDPTGWGSDLLFNVYFGNQSSSDMYPLYHIHEYGIPTNHSATSGTLLMNAKLVDIQTQTFQTWITPYKLASSLTPGWYCLEFDMSGYVPKGHDWLKATMGGVRFKFFPETANNQTITLNGALTGSVSGTFENEHIVQHGGATATSSILSSLGSGLSAISGMATNSLAKGANYAYLMAHGGAEGAGSILNPIKMWGGFACSVAGGLFNFLGGMFQEEVTYDTIPGKIDLTLDASITLNGYLKAATGNNHSMLSVSAKGIQSANGDNGHVGQGVWGLAEDPVVYIDKDDIISTQNSFNVLCTKDGYSNSAFAGYDARIVYAFDPTSVKININDDLFHDIQDITVTTNVGVIPNLDYGNTDRYRQMLVLGSRPQFSLADGKTSGTVELSARSTPTVTKIGLDELADGDYETAQNCSVVTQKTSDGKGWQRFHGRLINASSKQIIVDPQVYIPYTADGDNCTGIGFPTSPDFVVRVDVQFSAEVDGKRRGFQFGKLFIPQVKVVDYDEMCKVYDRLKDYSKKCEEDQPVTTLASDNSRKVRYPGGHILIGKTLRLLQRVLE